MRTCTSRWQYPTFHLNLWAFARMCLQCTSFPRWPLSPEGHLRRKGRISAKEAHVSDACKILIGLEIFFATAEAELPNCHPCSFLPVRRDRLSSRGLSRLDERFVNTTIDSTLRRHEVLAISRLVLYNVLHSEQCINVAHTICDTERRGHARVISVWAFRFWKCAR